MVLKRFLALPLLLLTSPVFAQDFSQSGGTRQTTCYETVYREEYVPGTKNNPGYVRRYNERVQVLCDPEGPHSTQSNPRPQARSSTDDNSCVEGTILGGLLGGGIGGLISRGDGRWIAVPTGAVAGALLGCQVDGG